MLTCRQVTEKSSQLIDGELGFRERFAVRLHLMMCVNCRRFSRQLKALTASLALRAESSEVASPDFVDRVMGSLENAGESSSPHPDGDHETRI